MCAYCGIDNVRKQLYELLYTYTLYNEENEVGPDSRHTCAVYRSLFYFKIHCDCQ